jgi:HAD superfamily hydrolase (TIGR01459 family)
MIIKKLNEILPIYDALLVDIWGVIHEGGEPYEGVVDTFNDLIEKNKKIIFLSNSPRSVEVVQQRLVNYGIKVREDMIYTSGELFRDVIRLKIDNLGNNIYHLGGENDKDIFTDLEVKLVEDLKDAEFMLINYFSSSSENIYADVFDRALELNLTLICPNPDVIIANGAGVIYCSGYFAKIYEDLGGVVKYYGKPHSLIYDRILEKLKISGFSQKEKILMVGDTFDTDITGGFNAGIHTLLVLSGNGKESQKKLQEPDLTINPTWIAEYFSYTIDK